MSCSGEIVDNDDDNLIQIRPSIVAQLKKAKYGVADHSQNSPLGDEGNYLDYL